MTVTYSWRGAFTNDEVNALHAEAFQTAPSVARETDWREQCARHSLGWIVARQGDRLVGFVNVLWDGSAHAWLQDVMVAAEVRRQGIGSTLVRVARSAAAAAGCQFLHVDFDDGLAELYLGACGFAPTAAGLLRLRRE